MTNEGGVNMSRDDVLPPEFNTEDKTIMLIHGHGGSMNHEFNRLIRRGKCIYYFCSKVELNKMFQFNRLGYHLRVPNSFTVKNREIIYFCRTIFSWKYLFFVKYIVKDGIFI